MIFSGWGDRLRKAVSRSHPQPGQAPQPTPPAPAAGRTRESSGDEHPSILTKASDLQAWLDQGGKGSRLCAIDTEADSLHRYRESLCLIQYAEEGRSVLIDPLRIDSLAPLGKVLESSPVWMHGADYDMTMLRRQFGFLPPVVYDTQIGARLLGLRKFGLADLVAHYFGVELSKTSQKADWGRRPLSAKMIEYALNDVNYLLPMSRQITGQLETKGRYGWFVESCESARTKVLDRDESRDDAWRIQGSGKLDRRGLAYLKALWHWRDREAKSWDRPTFMVAPNRELLEWTEALLAGREIRLPSHYRNDRARNFRSAVSEAEAAPESAWPEKIRPPRRKRDAAFDRKLAAMIDVRNRVATELDVDGSLIASRSVLEMIAGGDCPPEDVLMRWQRSLLAL